MGGLFYETMKKQLNSDRTAAAAFRRCLVTPLARRLLQTSESRCADSLYCSLSSAASSIDYTATDILLLQSSRCSSCCSSRWQLPAVVREPTPLRQSGRSWRANLVVHESQSVGVVCCRGGGGGAAAATTAAAAAPLLLLHPHVLLKTVERSWPSQETPVHVTTRVARRPID